MFIRDASICLFAEEKGAREASTATTLATASGLSACLPPTITNVWERRLLKLQGTSVLLDLPIHSKEYWSIANRVLVSTLLQVSSYWAHMMQASIEAGGDIPGPLPMVLKKAIFLYVTHFCIRERVRLWGANDTVLRMCHFTIDGDNTTTKKKHRDIEKHLKQDS